MGGGKREVALWLCGLVALLLCCFVALMLGCLVALLLCGFVALLRRCFVAGLLCCLRKAFGRLVDSFFVTFGYLLEAFWHRLDALGDFVWSPKRLQAHFGPRVQNGAKMVTIWLNFGGPRGPQFETILIKSTTF